MLRTLGRAGLLGLPYAEEHGGGAQPYEVYLQVLEILASRWLAVAEAVSVHTLSCYPVAQFGTDEQRKLLPDMIGGELLGAYCLSEPQGGSDAAALTTRAVRDGDAYVVAGTKAWITHARSRRLLQHLLPHRRPRPEGHLLPAGGPGHARHRRRRPPSGPWACTPRRSRRSPSTTPGAGRPADRRRGDGLHHRHVRPGLRPARHRRLRGRAGPGRPRLRGRVRQGAAAVRPARSSTSRGSASCSPTRPPRSPPPGRCTSRAARLRDAGRPYSIEAAKAKLFATDMAMRVTTDAVQVLGGYGYVADHPVERYMREAKVLQIVEGTNQIQRLVISRALAKGH